MYFLLDNPIFLDYNIYKIRDEVIDIKDVNIKLRRERQVRGWTYKDMANFLGYKSPSTYMYIEQGKTKPNLNTMNKLATLFNKPANYFFNIKVQVNWT